MTIYHRLMPCRVGRNADGERVYIDPSADWPKRHEVSVPHVKGNAKRNAPSPEAIDLARAMRPHVGLES